MALAVEHGEVVEGDARDVSWPPALLDVHDNIPPGARGRFLLRPHAEQRVQGRHIAAPGRRGGRVVSRRGPRLGGLNGPRRVSPRPNEATLRVANGRGGEGPRDRLARGVLRGTASVSVVNTHQELALRLREAEACGENK